MANLPTRNNNPGDLRNPTTGAFQVYSNPQQGFDALKTDLMGKITGNTKTGLNGNSTLAQFASVWAPNSDNNNSSQYAQNLAKQLGVDVNTPLNKLSNRLDDFASAIATNEGYQGNRVSGTSENASPAQYISGGTPSPELFKQLIVNKYPNGVASDGTPYAKMDATDLTKKIVAKYPNGVTNDGVKYADYLGQTAQASTLPGDVAAPQPEQPMSVGGFVGNVFNSGANLIGGLANAAFHPIKTVESITSLGAGALEKPFGVQNQDTQAFDNLIGYFKNRYGGNNPQQIAHNIVHSMYTDPVGVALDISTLFDGVGAAVGGVGKIADASKLADLAKVGEAAKGADYISTAEGLVKNTPEAIKASVQPGMLTKTGDVLSTIGDYTNPLAPVSKVIDSTANAVSKLGDALPRRIINNLLPQLKNPETIDYAVNNLKLGSVDSMLKTSEDALANYNDQINTILKHPDNAGITILGKDILDKTLSEFPNSEYTAEAIAAKVKSQVPSISKLVTKLENGSLSLDEANTLRQAVDRASYKLTIDSPEVRAGKEILGKFGDSLRDAVQTSAPETVPIFKNFSKEINLNKALIKLAQKSAKKGAVSLKELVTAVGATGLGGPIAGGVTLAAEKALDTPGVQAGIAKSIKSLNTPVKAVAKGVTKVTPYINDAAMAAKLSNVSQNK